MGASIGAWLGASGAGYLNEVYGWRTTLIVFGLCGIPVALIVWLFVREPKRGGNDDEAAVAQSDGYTLKDCLVYSWHNKAVMHVMLGAMTLTFWGWGIVWWTPSYLVRSFEMTVGDAGALLGPIHGLAGTAVMLLTVAAMYIYRNKPLAAQPRFVGWTTILGSIFSVAAYWLTDIAAVTLALWVFIPIIYIYIGPTSGLIQNLFPPAMRGKGIAMLLFLANIANLAIAPQLIGFLSDLVAPHLANPKESLRYVLLACTSTGFLAAFHYYAAARHISKREKAA
ncbi:D-galactonate transporter [compost metagenome]